MSSTNTWPKRQSQPKSNRGNGKRNTVRRDYAAFRFPSLVSYWTVMKLRKAKNQDVHQIRALINEMAVRTDEDYKHGHMLPRSLTELYEHLRDYTVLVDDDDHVMGCCALHSAWDSLAELKALAVDDSLQGHGWGRQLVDAALSEAGVLGIDCIFTLTNKWE